MSGRARMIVSVATVLKEPEIIGGKTEVETYVTLAGGDYELLVGIHGAIETLIQQRQALEARAGAGVPGIPDLPGIKRIKHG